MTKRTSTVTEMEFLTYLESCSLPQEYLDYVKERKAKIEERNEKRRNTPSKASVENAPILTAIYDTLTTKGCSMTASELAAAIGTSPNKVTYLCGVEVRNGRMSAAKIKSTAKSGGKINAYSLLAE